jgi:dTDP-4-amino-4,6-dideoxygalactose transaminase
MLLPEDASRQVFMETMRSLGVQTSIHYPPIHRFSYYQKRYPGLSLPLTETIGDREVTLPLYPTMSDADVAYVVQSAAQSLVAARAAVTNQIS